MTAAQPQQEQEGTQGTEPTELQKLQDRASNLEAELTREREARQRLDVELQAKRSEPPSAKPQRSREELQALVDQGALSEAAMLDLLNEQRVERVRDEIRAEMTQRQSEERLTERLQNELAAYKKHIPAITQVGSPERARLANEYDYLRQHGHPDNLATEVAALRAAFGEPQPIEERTRQRAETHVETAGAVDTSGEGPRGSGPDIPARLRAHYGKLIDSGVYSGWEDPDLKKEIEIARR